MRLAVIVALVGVSSTLGVVDGTAVATTGSPAVTKSVDATRTVLAAGVESEIEPARHVSVTVSTTTDLRDRQSIQVSWSGAHPSANTDYDPVSTYADYAEYPMVLLQCRGVDSTTSVISPTTCWQPWPSGRNQENAAGNPGEMYPPWRMDRYADLADRQQFSRLPNPIPPGDAATCPSSSSVAQHNLPFVGADGTVFNGTGNRTGCGTAPPESASSADSGSTSLLPDNASFAETDAQGNGSALFNVRDAVTNASLGCSSTTACSLVAIPIMGTSCDSNGSLLPPDQQPTTDQATAANTACEAKGIAPVGVKVNGNGNGTNVSYAVTGRLWWTASNWRNRISFPLTFAPAANVCDLNGSAQAAPVYGSEMLIEATTQWSAHLCAGGQEGFKHVQTSEPQARSLLEQGLVNAAFGSNPPAVPFSRPTVQAPVAATGFAISFAIDDANHLPVSTLRLTPRLLAKLLTESYPVRRGYASAYTYTDPSTHKTSDPLANNPLDITYDPEFIALNPGLGHQANSQGTGSLLALSSQSDVMFALTSYINADPEARDWLDGHPDPWGMVVNPNYKGIALPVASWMDLDSWAAAVNPDPQSQCDSISPQPPALGRIAAPLGRLVDIAQSVQFAQPDEQSKCIALQDIVTGQVSGYRYARLDRESPGFRFLIGVTSVAETYRYGLPAASLQSSVADSAAARFTDASGREFVAPTDAALRAAASHLQFDAGTGTWPIPYTTLRSDAAAYPGLQVIYADVLARGLSTTDAATYARMLTYVAGPGQVSGEGVGELPSGYLPLTAANGLADLAGATNQDAALVAAQKGLHPVTSPGTPPAAADTGTGTGTGTGGISPAGGPGSADNLGAPAGAAVPPAVTATSRPSTAPTPSTALSLGRTSAETSSVSSTVLIVVGLAAALGPVGVPILLALRRRRPAP